MSHTTDEVVSKTPERWRVFETEEAPSLSKAILACCTTEYVSLFTTRNWMPKQRQVQDGAQKGDTNSGHRLVLDRETSVKDLTCFLCGMTRQGAANCSARSCGMWWFVHVSSICLVLQRCKRWLWIFPLGTLPSAWEREGQALEMRAVRLRQEPPRGWLRAQTCRGRSVFTKNQGTTSHQKSLRPNHALTDVVAENLDSARESHSFGC